MAASATDLRFDAATARDKDRAVRLWLYFVAALVLAMVVVGGATRLTDSGLSITEWKPILGAIPPLGDADWQEAFAKYQQIPEYHLVNKGMTLEAFKVIYWWEWSHRFLGRLIGFAFALPLVVFWLRGRIAPQLGKRLFGVLGLGALQGAIGWYMVSSGLVDRVDVSQYRLALHLAVAFLIFALVLLGAFSLIPDDKSRPVVAITVAQRKRAGLIVAMVFIQVVLGALVAGLKAGLIHNTWPLMDGALVPGGLGRLSPWYLNVFENETTAQFDHRLMAYAVAIMILWQAWSFVWPVSAGQVRSSAWLLAAAVLAQVGLGIWTLLAAVPLWLGLVHQAGAAILLGLAVWHWHTARRCRLG